MADRLTALIEFMHTLRGRSQSDVLKAFLFKMIREDQLAESGSILVYNPETKALYLFNDGDFLFQSGLLERGRPWKETFQIGEGCAGVAFQERARKVVTARDDRFVAGSGPVPISHMVCIPIIVSNDGGEPPYGVVSFHNEHVEKSFSESDVGLFEVYVKALALALESARGRLMHAENRRVFIVHGRDVLALTQLQVILLQRPKQLTPVVLKDKPKTGYDILARLEQQIDQCAAGFVIMTPDDEGRLQKTPPDDLQPRARQNVVFEAGYLVAQFRDAKRVCFLVRRPLEIPSDLQGMLYIEFEELSNSKHEITEVLADWGL